MPKLVRSHKFVVRRKATHYPLPTTYSKVKRGFTLIELLVAIAILGILAAAILVAINPGKRLAQARDAQRKQDISSFAYALASYYTQMAKYPEETNCDSSIGAVFTGPCPPDPSQSDWATGRIYQRLVTEQQFLKRLPKDPINNSTYYYAYEPKRNSTQYFCGAATECEYYWIAAQLESPTDPAKPIFRCSDDTGLPDKAGCREVADQLNDETPDDQ